MGSRELIIYPVHGVASFSGSVGVSPIHSLVYILFNLKMASYKLTREKGNISAREKGTKFVRNEVATLNM